MPNIGFVLCLKHPLETKPLLFINSKIHRGCFQGVGELKDFDQIVVYGIDAIIHHIREAGFEKFPQIIDIETASRLITGRPKSSFPPGKIPWEITNLISQHVKTSTIKWLKQFQSLQIIAPLADPNFHDICSDLIQGLNKLWNKLQDELKTKGELDRFNKIETPIINELFRTEVNGTVVPMSLLNKKLNEIKSTYYSTIKKLEFDHDFISQRISQNLKWEDIDGYCSLTQISEELNTDFWAYANIFKHEDEFLELLLLARNSKLDFDSLLKFTVDNQDKIYPLYQSMGTVTGRILISSPGIQFLKKTSRGIFRPRENHSFIYADFDQFEPGIIASFSEDPELLHIYNHGDIYEELSKELFGSTERRKLCKTIFIAYMYGMTPARIKKLISETAGETASESGMKFFDKFSRLVMWKDAVCIEACENGFVETYFGNKRYLEKKGVMKSHEMRWIPNQVIQGTASYILKKALIELRNRHYDFEVIVPMHDAILLEVPEKNVGLMKGAIESIFTGEFKKVCPNINPSISFENFCEDT